MPGQGGTESVPEVGNTTETQRPWVISLLNEIWESSREKKIWPQWPISFLPPEDSQISFKRETTQGHLVFQQYFLLPAHKDKIIICVDTA